MTRIGVQFLDIENADLELQGTGKIPTNRCGSRDFGKKSHLSCANQAK